MNSLRLRARRQNDVNEARVVTRSKTAIRQRRPVSCHRGRAIRAGNSLTIRSRLGELQVGRGAAQADVTTETVGNSRRTRS